MPYPEPTLEKRIAEAAQNYQNGSKESIEDVYSDLLIFSLRVASKLCNRYIDESDEETSIASLSILEAFEKYQPERGRFLPYLGRVVRNRIIDYQRRESKHKIGFARFMNSQRMNEVVDDSFFDNIMEDIDRQKEVEALRNRLNDYGIGFADLLKNSPVQAASRERVKQVIEIISSNPELSRQVLEQKTLPAKELKENHSVSTKLLDRYRKYIIAGVIIITGNFYSMVPYVLPSGGKKNG
jgi:RNA polymerase sigma factor